MAEGTSISEGDLGSGLKSRHLTLMGLGTAVGAGLFLGVAVLFVVVSIPFGFPTGRDVITAWVLLLLLAACGGEWRTWRRSVVHDWLPLIGVLFLYDLLRGAGLHPVDRTGMVFNPLGWSWRLSETDLSVNYVTASVRE